MTSSAATILRPNHNVGIVGYGAYVPRYRLPASEIDRVWMEGAGGTPIREKSVPGPDEDVVTMSIEAARNALARAGYPDPADIRAVWVGSESHPYAVKPTSTIVAEAIGATPYTQAGDWEFACKAGTEAFQAAIGFVGSNMAAYALAIGSDIAQARPSDALEYTAAAGSAAYLIGPAEEALAVFEGSLSYATDIPDFWRRAYQRYPSHGGRFTGQPAYFTHIAGAVEGLMERLGTEPSDYDYVVFHQPNVKFPIKIGQQLGFTMEQIKDGLLVDGIGNTYAASSPLGLTAILDVAEPGNRILLASYGSGAGSDAMSFQVTEAILERQRRAPLTRDYIARRVEVDYATYARYVGKLIK
ncbi:MAG: hydroxymethylglutaryl-CoA synthase [Anaerolineae bacterium]|jgi:hydroxymethylglutaryl-CoA synthase